MDAVVAQLITDYNAILANPNIFGQEGTAEIARMYVGSIAYYNDLICQASSHLNG